MRHVLLLLCLGGCVELDPLPACVTREDCKDDRRCVAGTCVPLDASPHDDATSPSDTGPRDDATRDADRDATTPPDATRDAASPPDAAPDMAVVTDAAPPIDAGPIDLTGDQPMTCALVNVRTLRPSNVVAARPKVVWGGDQPIITWVEDIGGVPYAQLACGLDNLTPVQDTVVPGDDAWLVALAAGTSDYLWGRDNAEGTWHMLQGTHSPCASSVTPPPEPFDAVDLTILPDGQDGWLLSWLTVNGAKLERFGSSRSTYIDANYATEITMALTGDGHVCVAYVKPCEEDYCVHVERINLADSTDRQLNVFDRRPVKPASRLTVSGSEDDCTVAWDFPDGDTFSTGELRRFFNPGGELGTSLLEHADPILQAVPGGNALAWQQPVGTLQLNVLRNFFVADSVALGPGDNANLDLSPDNELFVTWHHDGQLKRGQIHCTEAAE